MHFLINFGQKWSFFKQSKICYFYTCRHFSPAGYRYIFSNLHSVPTLGKISIFQKFDFKVGGQGRLADRADWSTGQTGRQGRLVDRADWSTGQTG
jgi:hypothetical protein